MVIAPVLKKAHTASFTGHRRIDRRDLPLLTQRLEETIAGLIQQGVIYFGSGGAYGFDHLASFAVLKARELNPAVKLIMVLPCFDQDKRWTEADKQAFKQLLSNADKTKYVSERPYFDGCMELRNRFLVQHSGVCVAYMKHGRSGTGQTVRLAREQRLTVINLAEA